MLYSDERLTVIDELRHLTASAMMRLERGRRDRREAESLAALYAECATPDDEAPEPEPIHRADEQCSVGPDDCCRVCGVYHGDPCAQCGGRGFHRTSCPEYDR